MIPVYKPLIGQRERDYVADAVASTWISSKGEYLDRFERDFADFAQASEAVCTCNGTVSLHLLMAAIGIGPGDEVIVPSFTYVASVNAITYTGATPVFVDSEPEYWNIDPRCVESAITPKTKAIQVVHLYGHPADMDPILEVANRHGVAVIEDAAEAHGARYRGRRVGSFGAGGSFSFFGNKIITTGEGGAVVTNDAELAEKCRHLRGQGVSPTRTYWHDEVGFNYRMTNLAAAIGCAQIERVEEVLADKAQIARWYAERLEGTEGVVLQREAPWAQAVWWMNSVLVDPALRDDVMDLMRVNGVDSRPFFYPAHTLPMYEGMGEFPVAEYLGAAGINLPSYPELSAQDVDLVCRVFKESLEQARRNSGGSK